MNVREAAGGVSTGGVEPPRGVTLRSQQLAAVLHKHVPRTHAATSCRRGCQRAVSRAELAELLRAHQGNVLAIAGHYKKDRKQIYRWLELHRLDPRDFR